MKTLEDLRKGVDVALDDNDWCEIEDIVLALIRHMPGFAKGEYEQWNINDVKDSLQELGEEVHRKWGVRELKNIHLTVACELGDYAANYLATFWSRYGAMEWNRY